jgi:hypothetical protein
MYDQWELPPRKPSRPSIEPVKDDTPNDFFFNTRFGETDDSVPAFMLNQGELQRRASVMSSSESDAIKSANQIKVRFSSSIGVASPI